MSTRVRSRLSFAAGAALLAAGAVAAGALAASGDGVLDTTLMSRATGPSGAAGDGASEFPSTSPNGRYVAFESLAQNLDPESDDAVFDIFVRDRQANTTALVSRATGPTGPVADGGSFEASISADGRYVAFSSEADNLDPDSNDSVADIFVRDLQMNATTLVSRASGATGEVGDNSSFTPSISANGRYVAFQSNATNLHPDSTSPDVYVRDLQMNTTTLVSRASGATGSGGDSASGDPSISADGRYVAFSSDADNLDLDSDDSVEDVFIRDLQADTTTLVSRASGETGAVGDGASRSPSISGDGRRVAFESSADNLDTASNDVVIDAFVRDLQADTTTLASRASGAAGAVGDGNSHSPSISGDGRYVAFASEADNLDAASNDTVQDVFVRDLPAAILTLASRARGGAGAVGDADSSRPSAANRSVAFHSAATNLDLDSDDSVSDVFTRELVDPIPVRCAGQRATKMGTRGADILTGTRRRDVIVGLGGNDVIRGLAGNDRLCGGRGRDRLLGGRGRDRLLGGRGRDRLLGGRGRDLLRGGPGRDVLKGGPGSDRQIQ